MGMPRPHSIKTIEDFLAWESRQEERWEFMGGLIKMMAGGQVVHNTIAGNLFAALWQATRGTRCRTFQQNQKLAPDGTGDVVYPDVFITCRPLADSAQTVGGALLVAEVLSKSTAEDDYTWKWDLYREMPELRHYLILDSKAARITHYHRADDGPSWQIDLITAKAPLLTIAALDLSLPLAEIYAGTEFATGL